MKILLKRVLAVVAVAAASCASPALAATCSTLNFTTSTACVSPVTGGPGGNVTAAVMNSGSVFGTTGWIELASISEAKAIFSPQPASPNLFSFSYTNGSLQEGAWALNPLYGWGSGLYAFAIKGSTDNAVYLLDKAFTSGVWNVLDLINDGDRTPNLSNVRLFGTTALVERVPDVPLPAAGFLLIAALGGLVAVRKARAA